MAISATTAGLIRGLETATAPSAAPDPAGVPLGRRSMPQVAAKTVKVSVALDPTAILAALTPIKDQKDRIPLAILIEGRRLRADFAPKSIRRALATIEEHGADAVAVLVQGRLHADNTITDGGLSAVPKVPKAAQAA